MYIFGEFFEVIIKKILKSSLTNQTAFTSLFPIWEASNNKVSLYCRGKEKLTREMQNYIFERYKNNFIIDILSNIKNISEEYIETYSQDIVNIIKQFVDTWKCTDNLAKKALSEAEVCVLDIEKDFRQLSLWDDEENRMTLKEKINEKLFKAITFIFIASVDYVEVNSLEKSICDACSKWISDAQKSGRLVDYSEAQEQQEFMNVPLTALISSKNAVDKNNGCTIEDALFLEDDVANIMLTASGGSGKTFVMLELGSKLLVNNSNKKMHSYVPLYVPLNKFNDSSQTIYEYCMKTFEQYGASKEAMKIFSGEIDLKPLLLLDGFNEITSLDVQSRVVGEIADFRRNYPVVRFVVSSRYDFSSSFDGRGSAYFSRRELLELKDDVIITYLMRTLNIDEFSAKEQWSCLPIKMQRTLRRPMALSMFVKTKKRSDLSASYPFQQCERLAELLANYNYLLLKTAIIEDVAVERYSDILSYIGFRMVNALTFEVDYTLLVNYIKSYNQNQSDEKIDKTIEILEKTVLRKQLGGIYRFAHQNLRDFNCARHLAKGLERISQGTWTLCGEYFPAVYNEEIITLLGEYIQDYADNESVINKVIRVLKNHQSDNSVYRVIVQLIQTAKIVREDLHAFDFSDLDLSGISLNGYKLYRIDNIVRQTAQFNNVIISDITFAPQGHANAVFAMCLVEGRFLLSFSQHTVCCYNVENGTYTTIDKFTGYKPTVATYIGNNLIAVGDENKNLHIMLCKTHGTGTAMKVSLENNIQIAFPEIINRIQCIENNHFIVSTQNGCVYFVRESESNFKAELLCSLCDNTESTNCSVCSISYIEIRRKIGLRFVKERTIYVAYGNKIYTLNLATKDLSEYFCFNTSEHEQVCIFDICSVTDGLFIYYETATKCKVVYLSNGNSNYIKCELDETITNHFEGYSKFNKSKDGEVFICRNDQNMEKPNAYQLLVHQENSKNGQIIIAIKALSMGVQQLRVVEGVCLPDNKLATCSVDRSVQIMDLAGNTPTVCHKGNNNGIHEICMFDENTILCAQYSGEVSLWQCDINKKWYCTNVYPVHTNWVWSVEIYTTCNNIYMISASYDHTVRITEVSTENCIMTVILEDQVLSAHVLSDGNIIAHTCRQIHLIRIDYPFNSSDCCECLENSVIYSADKSEYIREIGIKDRYVIAAVNHNKGNFISKLFKIDLDGDSYKTEEIAAFAPNSPKNIKQFVVRCMDINKNYVAVGGDIKYNDNSKDEGFCYIINLENPECDTRRFTLPERISRVSLHFINANPCIYATSNYGNMMVVGMPGIEDYMSYQIANTQLLDIKIFGDFIYVASLDGCVYKISIPINNKEIENIDIELIIETVSGFRMCGIELNNATKGEKYNTIEQKVSRYLSDNTDDLF